MMLEPLPKLSFINRLEQRAGNPTGCANARNNPRCLRYHGNLLITDSSCVDAIDNHPQQSTVTNFLLDP